MSDSGSASIALFLPALAGGGAERVGVRVARELVARGFSVEIVVASFRGELAGEIPEGVKVVDLGCSLGGGRLLLSFFALRRYIAQKRPDILMSILTEANIIAISARLAARSRCRLVVSERNTLTLQIGRSLRKRALPWLVRLLYPMADCIHAVSHGVAQDLSLAARIPLERIEVIYNPVVGPELYNRAAEPLDHPWFRPDEPPVVLGAGRLVEAKDFPTLIRAFALARQKTNARLMILGEGPERSALESLSQELDLGHDISFPGFVLNPYAYMRRARVFVLSSAWEGLPSALIEAMCLCQAVVSTDCRSGPAEILMGGRLGTLVPVGDVRAMASAIETALAVPPQLGVSPDRQEGIRPFTVDGVVSSYIERLFGVGFSSTVE